MSTAIGLRAKIIGTECLFCHVVFSLLEEHPVSMEFINGYPSPCRHIGHNPFFHHEEIPWTKSVIEYDPVEIEIGEPYWMK